MSHLVVVDTDFLSSFLKIGRLRLIPQFYQVDAVTITPAVYREIALTPLVGLLAPLSWLRIQPPNPAALLELRKYSEYNLLGAGEQESIALLLRTPEATLLGSDNRSRRFAQSVGVQVVNIAAFLLACKLTGLLSTSDLRAIVDDLATLDYYRFRQDVLDHLLD